MKRERWYTVDVAVWAATIDPDAADRLLLILQDSDVAQSAVVTSGGEGPAYGAVFSLRGDTDDDETWAFDVGRDVILAALEKAGIQSEGVARLEVQDERFAEWAFEHGGPDQLLGVTEVAELLGVAKQRITQLRSTAGFPAPIAELAAGPVWKESSLQRFAATWRRRPGRPPRVKDLMDELEASVAAAKDTRGEDDQPGIAAG